MDLAACCCAARRWFWLKERGSGRGGRGGPTGMDEETEAGTQNIKFQTKKMMPVFLSPDIRHKESKFHQFYCRGSCCDRCVYRGLDAQPFQSVF